MQTRASERERWLGIDFSGDHRMWKAGCRNSNVWIAKVRRGNQFVLCDLRTVQELPGDGAPFHRLVSGGLSYRAALVLGRSALLRIQQNGAESLKNRRKIAQFLSRHVVLNEEQQQRMIRSALDAV